MSSQDKNLPYEILTLSHLGFKYCSVKWRQVQICVNLYRGNEGIMRYDVDNHVLYVAAFLARQIFHLFMEVR